MADSEDTAQEQATRLFIREAIQERMREEAALKEQEFRAQQKRSRDERAKVRKQARFERVRSQKQARTAALVKSQEGLQKHLTDASRALQAAIRAVGGVSLPRHSPEGREQQRLLRSLSASLGSLRAVGRSSYSVSDGVDVEVDDFDVGAVD